LYWTDFTGFGGKIISSRLDGTNKTQHHYRGAAIFWGVAAYLVSVEHRNLSFKLFHWKSAIFLY